MEALKFIWEGAIPLQIHLHESEVTTVPPPPPAMVILYSSFAALLIFWYHQWMLMNYDGLFLFIWEIFNSVLPSWAVVFGSSCVFNLKFWRGDVCLYLKIVYYGVFQVLAPRIGYLPLLASQIKPYFSSTLPPGVDTIWFEYKGLPLKWYVVLFSFEFPLYL